MKRVAIYLAIMVIGIILTIVAVEKAYEIRGCFSIGGEWFVMPLMLIFARLVEGMFREVKETFMEKDFDDLEG